MAFNQKGNEIIIFYSVAFYLPVDIIQLNPKCVQRAHCTHEDPKMMRMKIIIINICHGCTWDERREIVKLDWLKDSLFMKMIYV